MFLLRTVLGSFLLAASVAVAADDTSDHSREPWWTNPPADTAPATGPKITVYGPAGGVVVRPKAAADNPPGRLAGTMSGTLYSGSGSAAEFAPDPPASRKPDVQPPLLPQDPAGTLSGTMYSGSGSRSATNATAKPKTSEPPAPATAKPAPPQEPLPAAAAAGPASPAASGTTVLSSSASATAASLGLGSHNDKNSGGKRSSLSVMVTVCGSLAAVLGLFFVVAWAMHKAAPRGSLLLPKEVFEILGRASLGARQQVQLLRCGNKLLLVSITPNGTETLTEVTDPLEVDRIAGICQQSHPKSTTMAFRQVFQQLAPKSGEPSELDHLEPAGIAKKRFRWEEKNA